MMKKVICLPIFLLLITSICVGQRNEPKTREELQRAIRESKSDIDRRSRESFSRDDNLDVGVDYKSIRDARKARENIDEIAKVDEELKEQYKTFLKQSNTGIFRFLPDFDCETEKIIKVGNDCSNFVSGLWAYSFRRENYSNSETGDLVFKRDELQTGGLLSQGILVSLGDRPLDSVSLDSRELSFLTNFEPATELEKINEQYKRISEGIEQNGLFISNKQKVKVDNTYALRVIAYRVKDKWGSRFNDRNSSRVTKEERKFIYLMSDERNDSIYIFRIINKRDDDGGLTVLWKRLSKEKSPKINYRKDESLRDFK